MKRKVKPDDQYLVNLRDVSPVKNQLISENYEESVVVNRIACGDARDQKDNIDQDFGEMWQSVLWGGKTPKKTTADAYEPYKTDRDKMYKKSTGRAASSQKSLKRSTKRSTKGDPNK